MKSPIMLPQVARLLILTLAACLAENATGQSLAGQTPPAGMIPVSDVRQPIYGFGGSQTYRHG